MQAAVRIEVKEGPMKGRVFNFEGHDVFLFGRNEKNCHAFLEDDQYISRHHFILEVNSPASRLRDLGSRNGTYVNGAKHGGRENAYDLESAGKVTGPTVDLVNGDIIKAGHTTFLVTVNQANESSAQLTEQPQVEKAKITIDQPKITKETSVKQSNVHDADYDPIFDEVLKEIIEEIPSRGTRVEISQNGDRKTISEAGGVDGGNHDAREHKPSQEMPSVEGFHFIRQIGSGGMGAVFLAQRIEDNKKVAIKFLKSKTTVSPRAQAAFMREVAITRKIKHKHIIKCYETGCLGDQFYFVMEYCKGGSISRALRNDEGPPDPKRVCKFLSRLLKGLAFAHSHGLVHRDIKPANLLLAKVDNKWVPKIADFGLAKDFEKAGFSGMTATGVYGGSFPYMPREQLTNYKYVNPASDIFSLGVTFYRLITGEYPRPSGKNADPIGAILNGRIVPLEKHLPDYHPGLTKIINTAILDDCTKRFENGREMQLALKAVMDKEGWK